MAEGGRIDFMFLVPPPYPAAGSATDVHKWMNENDRGENEKERESQKKKQSIKEITIFLDTERKRVKLSKAYSFCFDVLNFFQLVSRPFILR